MENHGLDNVLPVLRRWAAQSDDPLPSNFKAWADINSTAAAVLMEKDPELVALLTNKATAGLKADALSGALSPITPDRTEQVKQRHIEHVTELYRAVKEAGLGNALTAELELAALEPAALEKAKAELAQPEDYDAANAQRRRMLKEESDARARSLNHGNAIAGATPWVATRVNRQLNSN